MEKIAIRKSNEDSVGVAFAVRGGSIYENATNNGLFHLCEHLIIGRRWAQGKIPWVAEIEDLGGVAGGFTTKDCVVLYAKVPQTCLQEAITSITNRLAKRWDERAISKGISAEKSIIKNEIAGERTNLAKQIVSTWWASAYKGHPLGLSPVGCFETLDSIVSSDITHVLNEHFTSKNTSVALVGNMSLLEAKELVESSLRDYPEGYLIPSPPMQNNEHSDLMVVRTDKNQVYIGLGFIGPQLDDPDIDVMDVIGAMLGEGVRSSLFQILRYRHNLVYHVGVLQEAYCCGGGVVVYTACELSKIEVVIRFILKELTRVKRGLLTEDELERAQRYLAGRIALQRSDVLTYATITARHTLYGSEPGNAGYASVTLRDIVRVARKFLKPTKLTAVFVGQISQGRAEKLFQLAKEMLARE